MKIELSLLTGLVFAAVAAPVSASPITIDFSNLNAAAGIDVAPPVPVGQIDNNQSFSTAFGFLSLSASALGNFSTLNRNWIDTGAGALFDFDFGHTRVGAVDAFAEWYNISLYFTPTQDTTYALSGTYTMVGPGSLIESFVVLADAVFNPASPALFIDKSMSYHTANESFILGALGDGDTTNVNQGSLTGTLLAGHQYYLSADYYIKNVSQLDSGASATGCLTLSIGGATGDGACGSVVPEPSTWLLLGIGLTALIANRRLSRRAVQR